jgi:hypothetical protein
MGKHRSITAEMTAHRRADLVESVERVLLTSTLDAPAVLSTVLAKTLDADLAAMLDDIMGLYTTRNTNNEEALAHAGWLMNAASEIYQDLEG